MEIVMKKVMYYDNISMSELSGDYLSHHGVLGMKWGIRRYQSYSTVPRKSGKGGTEIGTARKKTDKKAGAQKESYFREAFQTGDDFEITPGSRIYRSTVEEENEFRDRMYVSLTREDANRYAYFTDVGIMNYVDEYTPKLSLKICGFEEASKILSEVYKLPYKKREPREIPFAFEASDYFDLTEGDFETRSDKKVFNAIDVMNNNTLDPKPYIEALKKKGYDGVVDLEDCAWGETVTPTIIFGNKQNLERKQHYNIDSQALDMVLSEIWDR